MAESREQTIERGRKHFDEAYKPNSFGDRTRKVFNPEDWYSKREFYAQGFSSGHDAGLEAAAKYLDELVAEYEEEAAADDEFARENANLACQFRTRAAAIRAMKGTK